VARQNLNALTASFKYVQDIGRFGSLQFASNYTNILKREVQPETGDDYLDLLRDPHAMWNYQAFAKVRADGSIGWAKNQWTTTLYYNYIGRPPTTWRTWAKAMTTSTPRATRLASGARTPPTT